MSSVEDVSSDSLETSATNSGSDTVSIVIKRPREDNNGNNFECTVSKHLTVGEREFCFYTGFRVLRDKAHVDV